MKKSIISVVLVLAMVLSMSLNVFAADWETPIDVVGVAVVNNVYYDTLQDAVNNAGGAVVTLLADSDATVSTASELHLNLNGFTAVNVTAAKIYLSDASATTEAAGTGKLATDSPVASVTEGETRYIALKDAENNHTAHAFSLRLTDVSLRTEDVGMYYTAELVCDETLKNAVRSHGVVLSLKDMPGANFETESTDAYTVLAGAPGAGFNSGYVFNIFKNTQKDAVNTKRGESKIYANAYLRLTDGTIVMADTVSADSAWSLKDIMVEVNTNFANYVEQKSEILGFYNTWKNAMTSWNLNNIVTA